MGVIYPSRTMHARLAKPRRALHKSIIVILSVIALFVCVNLAIGAYYRDKTYPNTTVAGVSMGNRHTKNLGQGANERLIPASLTITYEDKKATIKLQDIGVRVDAKRTEASLEKSRSWLPIIDLFSKHELAAPVDFDDIALQKYGETLLPSFHQAATNARLSRNGSTFGVTKGKNGYDLSISRLKDALMSGVDHSKATLTAPVSFLPPKYTDAMAAADAQKIQATTKVSISLKAAKLTITPSANDIASWYAQQDNGGYTLSDAVIRSYILKASINAGTRPQNLGDAIAKTKQAIETNKPLSLTLVPFANTKTFHYCTALRGVEAGYQKALQTLARETFSDPRGWGLEGQVIFEETDASSGNCDFTLWLAAANQMPSFGTICDAEWSCRIGPNVVINFMRWQETSPAWKQYGGSVEDYRRMAVNHETGHWFGFEHSTCPAAGQIAPVMMQQSINLGGCTFNPWPVARELAVYRNVIGL